MATDKPQYTLNQLVKHLAGYRVGISIFPVEIAYSAIYWIENENASTFQGVYQMGGGVFAVLTQLKHWTENNLPRNLPHNLVLDTEYWIKVIHDKKKS